VNEGGPALPPWRGSEVDLSIVLPAYNESGRIRAGLEVLLASIKRNELGRHTTEIIVVDDGSTDDTAVQAQRLLASFEHSTVVSLTHNRGKGAAVRCGVALARGATIAFMDVDMAVHPSQLPLLLDALDDADVAIGSRALPKSKTEYGSPLRIVMGRSFARLVRSFTRLPLRDTQCGFKAYRAPVARILFHCSTIDRFAFDVEILTIARQLGFRAAEVPVHWCHKADSRIRPLADSVLMMADLIKTTRGHQRSSDVKGAVIRGFPDVTAPVAAARLALGPTMPVVPWQGTGALVLLPLCATDESERIVGKLRKSMPTADVQLLSLTSAQLSAIDPLMLAERCTPLDPSIGPPRSTQPASAGNDEEVRVHPPTARTG